MTRGRQLWMTGALTALAFLAPVKFGAPVVGAAAGPLPGDWVEWLICAWPVPLLGLVAGIALLPGLMAARRRLDWVTGLALVWLVIQAVTWPGSICWQASGEAVVHFAVCVLGLLAMAWWVQEEVSRRWVFGGLAAAAGVVALVTLQQHFGGLEETRRFALEQAGGVDPRVLEKLVRGRVFGPFVNPNMLAGFVVVAFVPVLVWLWTVAGKRWWPVALAGVVMAACLVLTGSRGGVLAWMVAVATGAWFVAGKWRWPVIGLTVALVAVGLWAMRGRGTVSTAARADYWRGAVAIGLDHPWRGTGPGTFGSIYPLYKGAGSDEEPQSAHNSYLQMWCDSGVLAAVVFGALWVAGVWRRPGDLWQMAATAGLAGFVVHQGLDFDLYVPGVAVPAFLLLGVGRDRSEEPARKRSPVGLMSVALAVAAWSGWQLATHGLTARNPQAWLAASEAALARGDGEQAVAAVREAVARDTYRASLHWRLAEVELRVHGLTPEGLAALREAARLNPTKNQYRAAFEAAEQKFRQAGGALLESAPR